MVLILIQIIHNDISTFNITKSGQIINLMSMLSENNKNYWFVI